ncbi:MAG: UDP-N-acetylglucosamine 2-epimerase (hydrolyzing) [Alphaproteobacteria bacterium]|nr:UDP-N-acetylglucosamine 2-epimerase (hydrolyzing) [Rhizobiaceae bacterium]MBU3962040.1 UDP-N-acetylglucosamine 2-epimerase (hydrolyzing) [Alphaproteobacteria bacterium]MBU4048109.1 UDP-N-acetylglucosamine 2-epimerase (hydrolyzing) [Alphaproteobacteria bacterium]MBU4091399.1 UDP-N-acetylglucosamine 2-epimerase (hydrolyzing) [Alphaproteobacteria bacterium]MBU4159044.1 UDP-N-acetylglucosamine 2-epimerase (hydrolyzing) [Alphaproteobacteria bacterium]
MTRTVHFLTGIRSEYDILAPIIAAVDAQPDLDAGVIVTGAHLTGLHGQSIRQIEADGYRIAARIDSLLASDGLGGRVKGMALQLAGLTDLFARERPDFLVVMGDREEVMTGAVAAIYHHIPVVHVGGGDHADDGNVDNLVRHAVSKMAHLHMATTELSGQRLRQLGEEPWRIHVTGASGLDRIIATPDMARDELERALGVDWHGEPYAVLLYHPTITDFSEARAHMASITRVLEASGLNIAVMAPNSDPGNQAISLEIDALIARSPKAKAFTFLERKVFINMLRHARVMVGNSSAGILEAPSMGLPVVNIGIRQRGREHGDNVIFTDYDAGEIAAAITRATTDEGFRALVAQRRTPYGDGKAGERIAEVLRSVELGRGLLDKKWVEGVR